MASRDPPHSDDDALFDRLLTDNEFWQEIQSRQQPQQQHCQPQQQFDASPLILPPTPQLWSSPWISPHSLQLRQHIDSGSSPTNIGITNPLLLQPSLTMTQSSSSNFSTITPENRLVIPILETKAGPSQRVLVKVPKQVPLTAPKLPDGKFQEGGVIINSKKSSTFLEN